MAETAPTSACARSAKWLIDMVKDVCVGFADGGLPRMGAGGQKVFSAARRLAAALRIGAVDAKVSVLSGSRAGLVPARGPRASAEGHLVDASAPRGDEGRGTLRKAAGRGERPLIRGSPNGGTRPVWAIAV